ncbi:MAG: alkaline phosphatase family protein [Terriglobia bacterium]
MLIRRSSAGLLLAITMSLAAASCRKPREVRSHAPQVVILGFDGADPNLVSQWMALGKLPNLARLAREGAFRPLRTTNPPESPVAWASFATGLNPGGTGIFDFLTRDPKTYLPELALAKVRKPKLLFGMIPIRRTRVTNERHGIPFYKAVADAGYKAVVLRMPLEFPPTPLPGGKLWAGLGVPDVRGTWGTFFYFSTEIEPWNMGDTEFGGRLVSLDLKHGTADAFVDGPVNPASNNDQRIRAPIRFTTHPSDNSVDIRFGGRAETVASRHWSGWFRVAFPFAHFLSVRAIARFYVIGVSPDLRIYMSPLNIDPVSPVLPISSPGNFAAQLVKAHGLFKTLGWWHDTWGLNEEKISDGVFLDDTFRTMQKLSDITVDELDRDHPRLLLSVFTSTDSVSHMFYRLMDPKSPRYDPEEAKKYGDAILWTYERMDQVVGRVEQAMEPGATLIIVSDHGFHSFRRGFNTNTWLVANGYMTLRHPGASGRTYRLSDLGGSGNFFPDVDWRQTRAYALGLGQIYLNLRGRERDGIVNPGAESHQLIEEICSKLLAYRDPKTHEQVLEDVYSGNDIFHGDYMAGAPDLQLNFEPGYRTSWQTSLGAIPAGIVVTNTRKWSGDHCSSDPVNTSGIFFSNRPLVTPGPSIVDIAPTVLGFFKVKPRHPMDGRRLEFAK